MNSKVTMHQVPGLPESPVEISTVGDAEIAGNHSLFVVKNLDLRTNPAHVYYLDNADHIRILFQNGLIPDVGHNGVTIEHLLAICGHRLEEFQAGPYKSDYNAQALAHIQALSQRTLDRLNRQVQDTYQK